jgi:F-type H+-transporting ATPase subunit gamma
MPGTKEIRAKIASVKNTQKITRAMQMVATSKMRRAQEHLRAARPYADKMRAVIADLAEANPDYRSPYLQCRASVKSVGIIVISTDRGLAGALNANVFKETLLLIREWQGQGATVNLGVVGAKGLAFFRRLDTRIVANVSHLGDRPHVKDLIGAVKVLLDAYRDADIDRLFLVNAEFVNTMTQRPAVRQLLPLEPSATQAPREHWDYIYEPEAAQILDGLLIRYVESQVYRGVVENVAAEMAARMVAMKAATDNAGKLVEEMQLIYNKARQAAITKELAEIVGGANALSQPSATSE